LRPHRAGRGHYYDAFRGMADLQNSFNLSSLLYGFVFRDKTGTKGDLQVLTPKTALFVLARQLMEWKVVCCLFLAALADFLLLINLTH
jgi:hypothetical protein